MKHLSILIVTLLALQKSAGQSHSVVRVCDESVRNPVETSVAIDPTNPQRIVAAALGSRANQPGIVNFVFRSEDGGRTWRTTAAPNPDDRTQADDLLRFDGDGRLFHAYISFRELYSPTPRNAANGIFVDVSEDGGGSWRPPAVVVDHRNTVTPFEDKPGLAVDRSPGSPYAGRVYVGWSRFDAYKSRHPEDRTHVYVAWSNDRGRSFGAPLRISEAGGDCLDSDNTLMGVAAATGPDGEAYFVWAGPRGLEFDRSLDGGSSFATDTVICQTPGGWDIDIAGVSRNNGLPSLAVDTGSGPRRGAIYVNWIDARHGDPDVFVACSSDQGRTWTAPVRVNDDPIGNGREQFFSALTVDSSDGAAYVAYLDRRAKGDNATSVVLARSIDGGRTFQHFPVDLPPFATNPRVFFGDYIGVDAVGGRVAAVFPHFVQRDRVVLSAAVFDFR